MMEEVFRRIEKKYLLTQKQKSELLNIIKQYIQQNKYYFSSICNVYYDTERYDLIRQSIEKPLYKEKIRIRSYKVPTVDDNVFIEIKKKFEGVVSKRRISIKLKSLYNYLEKGIIPKANKQIFKELDYCFKKYNLISQMYISYDRYSYCGKEDDSFRITFDTNIKFRDYDLNLEKGIYGETLIDNKTYLMEVKSLRNMPIWFTNALSKLEIYPISFSKYGIIYENKYLLKNQKIINIEKFKNKKLVSNM